MTDIVERLRNQLEYWNSGGRFEAAGEIEHLRATRAECERQFQAKVEELGREIEATNTLRAAIRSTASQGTYDETAIRKAVGFELAEMIVEARRACQQQMKREG